jgi:hypothetical protein
LFDLWPLTPEVKAIPPLEYAYFDPKTGGYIVLKSKAIPLQVLPAIKPAVNKEEEVSKTRPPASEEPIKTKPIEIQGITPLSCKDLHNLWLGGWDLFALVPIGIALLLMQMAWRDALEEKRKRIPIRTSKDLLREAEGCLNQPKQFFPLLNRALIVWLKEQGAIERSDLFPESLPDTGVAATVKAFLMRIQELRFTGQEDLPLRELLKQAEEIMGTHPKEEGETL